jgi:hypothetical protein
MGRPPALEFCLPRTHVMYGVAVTVSNLSLELQFELYAYEIVGSQS